MNSIVEGTNALEKVRVILFPETLQVPETLVDEQLPDATMMVDGITTFIKLPDFKADVVVIANLYVLIELMSWVDGVMVAIITPGTIDIIIEFVSILLITPEVFM